MSDANRSRSPDEELHGSPDRLKSRPLIVYGLLNFVGIFLISQIAGTLPGPADPISGRFFSLVIFPVALLSFGLGLHSGTKLTKTQRRLVYLAILVLTVTAVTLSHFELRRVFARHEMLP